jgi:CO dehydrogenase/acetyl-CoA synthase gamma subunit (corrinoid Fe-S protein)
MRIAVTISDSMSRSGQEYLSTCAAASGADLLCIRDDAGDAGHIVDALEVAVRDWRGRLIIESASPESVEEGLDVCGNAIIMGADVGNVTGMSAVAARRGCPLVVRGRSVGESVELAERASELGVRELILDPGADTLKKCLETHVALRRAADSGYVRADLPVLVRVGSGEYAITIAAMSAMHGGDLAVFDNVQPYELIPFRAFEAEFR